MNNRLAKWFVMVVVALAVSACAPIQTEPRVTYPIVPEGSYLDLEYPVTNRMRQVEVQIIRPSTRPVVVVTGVGSRSRTGIEWSATWVDGNGREIQGTSSRFRRTTINPGVRFQLEAEAPVESAQTVRVRIRQSGNM